MEEADFHEAKLTSVLFENCSLVQASIAGVTFTRSELRGCDITALGNAERLRGVRMPWANVIQAAGVFAQAVGMT
jgi:uncharacterized protein YjbI with pentapeptide repeats